MKIPIIELFKLALDMLIWHLFFSFFRNHIFDLKARSKQKAHRKVATISDPDDAARDVELTSAMKARYYQTRDSD